MQDPGPEEQANRNGAGGGRVAVVVTVSPAFEAAIRAVAREAAAENMRAEATRPGCEAAFAHMHEKVRAAARELLLSDARTPLCRETRRGFR
jgi:hypothetical protein